MNNQERLISNFRPDGTSFLDEIDVCISIKDNTGDIIANNFEIGKYNDSTYCIDIVAETQIGYNAIISLSENGIIDGLINITLFQIISFIHLLMINTIYIHMDYL